LQGGFGIEMTEGEFS